MVGDGGRTPADYGPGLDSLDAVDLVVALEKALRVQIPETVAREMRTVGDVHEYIRGVAGERH
jgi:acyl carrier protein